MTKSVTRLCSSIGFREIKNLLFTCLFALILNQSSAQTLITIGTGTGAPSVASNPTNTQNGASPYGINTGSGACGKKLQMIYTPAMINAAMTTAGYAPGASFISTVGWNITGFTSTGNTLLNYTVKMANVVQADIPNNTSYYSGAMTTVYGPSSTTFTVSGWFLLNIGTPFQWDGTSNLCVEVCYNTTSPTVSTYGGCQYTDIPGNNHMIYAGSASTSCATSLSGATLTTRLCNMRLTVTSATPCAGIPSPGTPTASPTSVCAGTTSAPAGSTLSLPSLLGAGGYTYQWQVSGTNGSGYVNASGTSTNSTYSVPTTLPFSPSYYICNVTCTNSGQTGASGQITVDYNSFLNCYCNGTNTAAIFAAAATSARGITNVNLAGNSTTISQGSSANTTAPYYTLYSGAGPADLTQSTAYNLIVTVGTQAANNYGTAWIDYDHSGSFDAGERIGSFGPVNASTPNTIAFTVPGGVLTGTTGMRVLYRYNASASAVAACGSISGTATTGGAGEIEDYRVSITAGCTAPTVLASGAGISPNGSTSQTINWTRGNGDAVIVVARPTAASNAIPTNGSTYSSNSVFASGSTTGTNNFVVYTGTGTSVNVTGLTPSTSYTYSVYEYVSATSCYAGASTIAGTTLPCQPALTDATSPVFSNITNNATTLTVTRGSGTNLLIIARLTATGNVAPTFNASYTANSTFGSGSTTGAGNFVVYNGTGNSVTVTGLANNTSYTYIAYEYNASPNCYTITPLSAAQSTLDGTLSGGCAASVVRTTSAQFSGNDANYTSIAPAVVINNVGTTTGYYQGGAINTPGAGLPIGFNFVYNGTTYTTFGLGVNGYIWFGSGVPSPTATYPIGNASANLGGSGTIDGIICAAGIYLENANTPSVRNIGYTLSGITPNRVLKIQWQGYSTTPGFSACNGSFNDGNRFDFQIILNENGGTNSNKIGIAFPDMSPYCVSETGPNSLVQIGLRGADNTVFTNRSGGLNLSGSDWAATAGAVNTATCHLGNSFNIPGNYIVGNVLLTFTQALVTGPTINGFASGGTASNSCPATNVLLTAGAGFSSYQWFLNGSIIPGPGSSASTYTATQSGSYTVVGKSGNCYVQSNTFTVTINSCGTAPSFTTCPVNQAANTSGSCNATVNYTVAASGTPTPTLAYSFSGATTGSGSGDGSGSVFNKGTTVVTITASNGILPDATCTFNVVVTDNESPVPTVASLPDVTAECSATATAPTATDNCAGTITATTLDPTSYSTQGSFVIHWSYDDGNGNIVTQNQNVIIDDVTNPVPTLASLPDITAECSATATAPTATDNCSGTITATTVDPTSYSTQGSFVIHWSYNDGNGNIVTQNQNVIIDDVTNPVPTLASLPDITAECSATATAPTATDNCSGTITATTADPTSYSTQGSFVIHWSYNDGNGNIVTQNQNVIIDDVTNPIINDCPVSFSSCNPVVSWTAPTASDNCGTPLLNSNFAPGSTFPIGTTTVTYTADDGNGNIATCSFNVTINSSSVQATSATSDSPFNTICVGGTTNLSVNGGSLGLGASWKWYSGSCGGTLVGNGPAISVTPTANTTYFVRAEGTCNTTACVSVAIVVSSSPVTSLALMPFTGMPANLCNGTVATLSVAPVNKATFYVWDAPTGSYFNGNPLNVSPFTTATPSVTITFGNPSGSLYNVGVQAGNACGSSVRQAQKVRGSTSVPAAISGALTACANTSLTYTTGAVTDATSYLWTITGNATVSGTGTSVTVTFGAGWTGGTLCVSSQTTCYTSASKCINITSTAATLGNITGTFTACPNAVLTYSVPVSAGAASYTWTAPAGSSITNGQGTNSVSVTYSPTYSAIGNICVNVTSVCGITSANKCKTVAPGLPSQPSSISGPLSGLCNQTVVFTCPAQGGATSYNWTAPGGSVINSGQGSTAINVTFGTFTTGSICVASSNACGSSTSRCVTVKGAPATPGAITAIPGSWCSGTEGIEFDVSVANMSGIYSLSWTYPSNPVANYVLGGGNSTSLIMDWGTGTGNVNVKASNLCGSGTKTSTWSSTCRESEISNAATLTALPNPTTGLLNISYLSEKGYTQISVLDLTGRIVIKENALSGEGANHLLLDMSQLAKGPYVLKVKNKLGTNYLKIVVE